jgi:hypothetical protein
MIVVLIPLFTIFIVAFLLWVAILTLIETVKISFITIVIALFGVGPYAYNYSKECGIWKFLLLSIGSPFSITIGVYRSFKELFSYIVFPLLKRYKKTVKKCWYAVFIDSMSE